MHTKSFQVLLLQLSQAVPLQFALNPSGAVMAELRRNTAADFGGLPQLKRKQAETLSSIFEAAATSGRWGKVHKSHYDWWMFPIAAPSSYGTEYSVYDWEVHELLNDATWVASYLRGVELLARSWGWHLQEVRPLTRDEITDAENQKWAEWPIRLSKCYNSLRLFGFHTQADSMKTYGQLLLRSGKSFDFRGRDLSGDFK